MANSVSVADRPEVGDVERRKGLLFISLAVGFVGFAMAMQIGLNANFVADVIGLKAEQVGLLEAFRESCGIIALFVLALLAGLAEPLVAAGMLVLFGIGLSSYCFVHNYAWVIIASMAWSQGLHVWMPLPNSMTLSLAEKDKTGYRLGQVQSIGAAGFTAGLLFAMAVTGIKPIASFLEHINVVINTAAVKTGLVDGSVTSISPIRPLYILAGLATVAGAAFCLGIPRKIKTPGPRLVFKRRYRLYYLLSFLEGWRKQIFMCFAGYLLVKTYHTDVSVMLLLLAIVQAVGYFTSPQVGKLIDRIGERKVLIFYYLSLVLFFIGYATITNVHVLYGIFVLDNAFFVFAMALNTYVNRIAPRNELTPTLSMGVAMNHVAAVTMPLIGGILWKEFGYQWPFLIGAGAALLSLIAIAQVPRHGEAQKPAEETVSA